MPTISLWDQNPAQNSLDRFTSYYLATCQRLSYSESTFWKNTLFGMVGATSWQRVPVQSGLFPPADIAFFSGNRALLTIAGTRSPGELVRQALGSGLVPLIPLPGRVSQYFAVAMTAIVNELLPIFTAAGTGHLVLNGHSQGGALCQIMPGWLNFRGGPAVLSITTCAAPRSGDFLFAAAQSLPYTRISAAGDPVPALPPSVDPVLDAFLWILLPPTIGSYRHWGTHFHLFSDGSFLMPPDASSWSQGMDYLVNVAQNQVDWFDFHNIAEYAKRLRVGIPVDFGVNDPAWPGLQTLDQFWAEENLLPPAAQWSGEFLCS